MATRLLQVSLLRHLRHARKQVSYRTSGTQHLLNSTEINVSLHSSMHSIRTLHVKVYDKDAGHEEQRQANKHKQFEAVPQSKLKSQIIEKSSEFPDQFKNSNEKLVEKPVMAKEEADTFGNTTLATESTDAGDELEEEYTQNALKRRLRSIDYAREIKTHLNANRLKEALDVFEEKMVKQDHAKPDMYIFSLLISGCARAGYTRKAFNLFTRMRQRGLKAKASTYTSLFNACANAPSANFGLENANRLREIMLEKNFEPNGKNYNAMIKAYGRCGDVKTAYLLADEMMERNIDVNVDTFNFLLQACASDTELGFRHALLTWHKLLQRGFAPDYYTFNTLLRCVRDCGFGDLVTMEQVLQQILAERNQITTLEANTTSQQPQLTDGQTTTSVNISEQKTEQALQVTSDASELEMPDLLALRPHLGSLVSLGEVTRPHERFLLLGGLHNFLHLMKRNNVTPDIEMFTALLEVIPLTYAAEKQLLSYVRKIGLKADIDFFNILIKKRSMRFDYDGAKEVLSMIRTAGLYPDIVTYGVLALGCQTVEESRELLQQMHNNGVRMNIQILGAMLRQGCEQKSFEYVIEIMQISLDENVRPNPMFLTHMYNFYNRCARAIDARHPWTKSKAFKKEHAKFCDKLRLYYEEHDIAGLKLADAINKIKEHPYKQYKESYVGGMEPLKNEKISRKKKLRKYIKKIKIANLRSDETEETLHIEGKSVSK